MATSGKTTVRVTSWDNLEFEWSVSSQSVAQNTTVVKWYLWLVSTSSGEINSNVPKNWKVKVNGVEYSGITNIAIANYKTKTLASGTTVIEHNDDGTKAFSYSFSQQFDITFSGNQIGTVTGYGSGTLNAIPRASQPSCITWPEHTQNVGYFGDTISIHMNRKTSSATHTVRYQFGSQSGTIATDVGTGTTWTIPLTLMNLIPNNTSGSGTIYVDTYSGDVIIGTKYCGFTAKVPDSVKPTCTVSVSDPTGNATTYGAYVIGLSKIAVTVTPTLAYNSPIRTYNVLANGSNYTTASFTTGLLKSGSGNVHATVTDGRGRQSLREAYTVRMLSYTAPTVTKLTVGRCDEDGTANMSGGYVQATFSATVTPLNDKNTATYKIRYKKTTDTTFTEVTISDLDDNYTVTNHVYRFEADTSSSYDVEVTATDNHSTATRSTSASTAFAMMHFRADGTGLGLLKVAEKPNAVDVGGDMFLNGHALYGAHGMTDTRETNESPEWYMANCGRGTVWEFKDMTAIEFTSPSTTYAPLQTIIPWKDASGGYPRQVVYEGTTRWTRIGTSGTTWSAWRYDALSAYPVGSIYIAYNHTNPGTLFGGTWQRISNAFLWGVDGSGTIGQTGGSKEHTLTQEEMPQHDHGGIYSGNVAEDLKNLPWLTPSLLGEGDKVGYFPIKRGGDVNGTTSPHNNMPPYIQVSIWRRTA